MPISMRRAELDDQQNITSLIGKDASLLKRRFGRFKLVSLIETSFLSVTAVDDNNEIVGFACFEDEPNLADTDAESFFKWFVDSYDKPEFTIVNTLFMTFFVASSQYQEEVAEMTLRTAFTTLPQINQCISFIASDISPFGILRQAFEEPKLHPDAEESPFPDMKVYVCKRSNYIPNLKIRIARVEDHDDLVPVFDSQSEVLTELYGEFFLAEMIQAQDEENKALVAEVGDKSVGLMSLSSEMDVVVLQQCFDLDIYDNLVKPAVEEEVDPEVEAAKLAEQQAKLQAARQTVKPKVIVVAPPSVNVADTCAAIAERYGCTNVTEKVLLAAMSTEDSEMGQKAKGLLENGGQPDEELLLQMALCVLPTEEFQQSGWVLGSFPMTQDLTQSLAASDIDADMLCVVELSDDDVRQRISGLRKDPETGTVYDMNVPEQVPTDDDIVARLEEPMSEEAVTKQLEVYNQELPELCQPFQEVLVTVSGLGEWQEQTYTEIESKKGFVDPNIAEEKPEDEEEVEVPCNAFAVTLFCLDEMYESRAVDFLEHAFAQFPDREYCLLTLPPTSAESSILSHFVQVPPRPGCAFSHVLYLVNRSALLVNTVGDISVRRAGLKDVKNISDMLGELGSDGDAVLKEVKESSSELDIELPDNPMQASFVIEVASQLVGVAVLDRKCGSSDEINWLKSHFHIEDFVLYSEHRARQQGFLSQFVINPIFARATRHVLKELMRLYKKSVLYYRQYPGMPVPDFLPQLVQVKRRRLASRTPNQPEPDKTKLENDSLAKQNHGRNFSLYFLTHKLFSEPKLVNNSRIVVVGASDAGLSFLETLLMVPYMQFTSLTLLSPGGLPRGYEHMFAKEEGWLPTSATGYSRKELDEVGYGSHVRFVDSKLVAIDREGQAAIMPDGSCLPYDYLVLTTGLQDGSLRKLGFASKNSIGEEQSTDLFDDAPPPAKFPEELEESVHFLTDEVATKQLEDALKDYRNGTVVVYGSGYEAIGAVNTLLENKVRPKNITLVRAAGKPSGEVLSNEVIENAVFADLRDVGVTVLNGTEIFQVEKNQGPQGGAIYSCRPAGQKDAPFQKEIAKLVIFSDTPNCDPDVFQAINGCGLVYDGRLVVDLRFCTTDPAIYSGGSLCKFSRRYRNALTLENFNSREVGARLARSVLQVVDPLSMDASLPDEVPTFRLPTARCLRLPSADGGNMYWSHVKLPKIPANVRSLVTKAYANEARTGKARYCNLQVDSHGRVVSFSYLGPEEIEVSNLCCLVGMQEAYLNSAVAFFNKGSIQDWITFFREDWADALYHDRFHDFCLSLRMGMQDDEGVRGVLEQVRKTLESGAADQEICQVRREAVGIGGCGLPPSTKKMLEMHLLEYLKNNRNLLNRYWPGAAGK